MFENTFADEVEYLQTYHQTRKKHPMNPIRASRPESSGGRRHFKILHKDRHLEQKMMWSE